MEVVQLGLWLGTWGSLLAVQDFQGPSQLLKLLRPFGLFLVPQLLGSKCTVCTKLFLPVVMWHRYHHAPDS